MQSVWWRRALGRGGHQHRGRCSSPGWSPATGAKGAAPWTAALALRLTRGFGGMRGPALRTACRHCCAPSSAGTTKVLPGRTLSASPPPLTRRHLPQHTLPSPNPSNFFTVGNPLPLATPANWRRTKSGHATSRARRSSPFRSSAGRTVVTATWTAAWPAARSRSAVAISSGGPVRTRTTNPNPITSVATTPSAGGESAGVTLALGEPRQ